MSDESEMPDPGHLELFAALGAPFEAHEVRQRSQAGRTFQYITARVAMNRLDNVMGPTNWWDEYIPGENSVLCKLTLRLPDGTTLTKCDAGGYAGMPDQGDDDKSGFSDSFKRAAVKIGVGRYLYRDGVPNFVHAAEPVSSHPVENVPAPQQRQQQPPRDSGRRQQEANGQGERRDHGDKAPTSGRGMFAWCKEQEQKHEVGLIKYLNGFMKLQEMPSRMVDLDQAQVSIVYAEAIRKLNALSSGYSDTYEEALAN